MSPRHLVLLLLLAAAWAQTAPPPPPQEDFSGLYEFLREGETLQLSVEEGQRLSGFITRFPEDDRGPKLDHFFKDAKIQGNQVSFSTRTVHGVWFDFRGAVERGSGKTRADEGYYVLHGTLTQHTGDAHKKVTSKSREVWFKSFPRLDDEPAPK